MPWKDRKYQGRMQTVRAKEKRELLVRVLSDGACALCGATEKLEIDHPRGAGWEKERYSSDQRVRLYWKEFWANVPLRVLCESCNKRHLPLTAESPDNGES